MTRTNYIQGIREWIAKAKITRTFNADFETNQSKSSSFPSFDEIFKYINNSDNSKKFFDKIQETLENYKKFVNQVKPIKCEVSYAPLLKRIKSSDETLHKMLTVLNENVVFEPLMKHRIQKRVTLTFNSEYSDSLNFIFDLLNALVLKIQDYIITNSIYNSSYRMTNREWLKEFKDEEPAKVLSSINQELKRTIDKKFVSDFFSDGKKDVVEMMSTFWKGLAGLLCYTKPYESSSYNIDGKKDVNINAFFEQRLVEHYKSVDEVLNDSTIFENLSDSELKDQYERILKIKIPRGVDPTSEKDLKISDSKAEQKLASLIGLESVKESIEKIKAYVKANKKNGKYTNLNLHMVFTGNPGTGKTEVAKLIGEILYDNGVLPKKSYVEATRSTLVGAYVGDTALKTDAVIEKAMGGVLFIDEAYSLAHENDPIDFGHEAVAELIKGMEDNKGKFCVILAGYKGPMEKMLATNQGFNSRLQFHIDFPNYSRDELEDIFRLMLEKDEYLVEDDALNRMLDITDVMRKNPDFANARDARNILQQCEMNLNLRSVDGSNRCITVDDVNKYIEDAKISVPKGHESNDKILTGEEQLMKLIGLDSIKKSVRKIKSYARKNKGSSNLNLHMAFTGNPGTGKTEVADIISRVLYEAGVLPEAKVILGNRTTLVGKYIGETAIKTKEAISKAMGGVLFIDEAYSLSSGGEYDYGAEAIAILIDEMEKNKGKFCVVLAGYEKPLMNMIASNPGFNSRIQFYLNFPDYTRDELKEITMSFLARETIPYTISDEAMNEMLDITDYDRTLPDFANARTIRTMLTDIIMNQNLRVEDESDNDEIIMDDVIQYENDNHLDKLRKRTHVDGSTLPSELIDKIKHASENYDSSKIDNSYYEQAVISISGNDGSQGTGFIITPDGLCLTCAHCIQDEKSNQKARIILTLANGQRFKNYVGFETLFVDNKNDFALLKLEDTGMIYSYLPLTLREDSSYDPLHEFIMAGYPFGGESYSSISITEGRIASVNNLNDRTVVFADMFGKPGNSGSPVIDKETKKAIGVFFGGISDPNTKEMIKCFTPVSEVWKTIS